MVIELILISYVLKNYLDIISTNYETNPNNQARIYDRYDNNVIVYTYACFLDCWNDDSNMVKPILVLKQKWCREYGLRCKDENCPFEHLSDCPKMCNALLEFKNCDNAFVMCELDLNHTCLHQALMFQWKEYNEIYERSEWLRGLQLIKARMGVFK